MIYFSTELDEISKVEECSGKLQMQFVEDKLMHSVLSNDKETINDGRLIEEGVNQGMAGFTPSLMFEQMTKNFSVAKNIYGEKLFRLLTGYDASYLEKNIRIPEFQKELKKAINKKIDNLKQEKLLDKDGRITDKGIELASLTLYFEEIDKINPSGMGEKAHKKISHYGERSDVRNFKKGDRYKDISVRKSVRNAIRRGHNTVLDCDLKVSERQSKGAVYVVYGLDSSASMKGEKIHTCKKAGIALSYKAIMDKDKVGLVVFGTDVEDFVAPTDDFGFLLNRITRVKTSKQTDFKKLIEKAAEIFPNEDVTKHLVILTDALPTAGEKPEEDTLHAVASAFANGITISMIGIKLDANGIKLGKEIAKIGGGRLYIVKNLADLDRIVLEDYYSVR